MIEKVITFEEFQEEICVELARRFHAKTDSKVVIERLEEQDSIDIIVAAWESYGKKTEADWTLEEARWRASIAANCIAML